MKECGKSVLVTMNEEVSALDILRTLLQGKLERFTNLEYNLAYKKHAIVDCIEENDAKEVEALLKVEMKDTHVSRN